MKTAKLNFLQENKDSYTTRIGEIQKSDVLSVNEHNQILVRYDVFEKLYNEKHPPSKKIMEWEGKKMKYGIPQEVVDILGEVVSTVPANMLDGMGTSEAKEIKAERLQLKKIGAIQF